MASIPGFMCVFSIVALSPFVNAAQPSLSEKKSPARPRQSVSEFVKTMLATGYDKPTGANISPHLGVPPRAPSKTIELEDIAPGSVLKLDKSCAVVLDTATLEPASLIFLTGYDEDPTVGVSRYYMTDLSGGLTSAIALRIKRTEDGKVIRGSAVKEILDVSSPDVRKDFRAELDFWLSGRYRRHVKPLQKEGP